MRYKTLTRGTRQPFVCSIEALREGSCLATSPDVPGLVAEGCSVTKAVEIAQGLTRKIIESCLEHGDPLPKSFAKLEPGL